MGALFYISLTIFLLVSSLLCLVILIQESKSLGLGASFGGDAGDSLFGTSTADVLKKITTWIAAVFLFTSIFLSIWSEWGTSGALESLPTTIEKQVEQ